MKTTTRGAKLLISLLTALGILFSGLVFATAPAQAATVHNRMAVKINKVSYVLDSWNTTSKRVTYNIDCHTQTLWGGYRYTLYKASSPSKKYVTVTTDPLHAYYLNDHYWAKARSYKSVAAFKKVFTTLETRKLETVKESIGFYCLRDVRRSETKLALSLYVGKIERYVARNSGSDVDLSTVDFAADELAQTEHKFSKSFSLSGTPASGFTASVTDKTDGYRWSFTSATQKYVETKL